MKFVNYTYTGCNITIKAINGKFDEHPELGEDAELDVYEGKIQSFCLLFCDQKGINCEDCSPNGGLFSNAALNYCLGDPILANLEEVSFPVFTD